MNQNDLDRFYMDIALRTAENSYCARLKVGAILVKERRVISFGFNGTITGFPNICETIDGRTSKYVLHAEENCILKVAQSHESSQDSTLYITHSPCEVCSRLIIGAGIKEVVYNEIYRDCSGLDTLYRAGVESRGVE